MEQQDYLRFCADMPMLEAHFEGLGWACGLRVTDSTARYREVHPYTGGKNLKEDCLYVLSENDRTFPADSYACLSPFEIPGSANQLWFPGHSGEAILEQAIKLFAWCREQEYRLDQAVFQDASLTDMCSLGEELMGNPIIIHDDWFIITAMSQEFSDLLNLKDVENGAKNAIPWSLVAETMGEKNHFAGETRFVSRSLVEDFRFDSDYLETYSKQTATLWQAQHGMPEALYVNIWDGEVYRGRLLVIRSHRAFQPADYRLAEVLAQRCRKVMQYRRLGERPQYRSMDTIVSDLLQGVPLEAGDLTQLMTLLSWQKEDQFVCVRIKPQQPGMPKVMENVLHSDLIHIFPKDYVLLVEHQQSIILNLNRTGVPYSRISHLLAPLCRDYCLYGGISSPVRGIQDAYLAAYQAEIALSQAFERHGETWIVPFSDCALDYLLTNLTPPLQAGHLVAPELRLLREHDQKKGTEYFETFRAYLLQERDIPRTSEKLIIHRTTLLYRLKKIQTLITCDLEDPWKRLYLLASLKIMEGEGKP